MGNRNEFTIIWRIVDFSILWQDPNYNGIRSPTFLAENLERNHFYLILFHKGENSVDEKYLSCRLGSDVAADGTSPMECTMEIITAGGETLQSKTFSESAFPEYQLFEWGDIITTDELLNKSNNWTEDSLTVRCHIFGEVQTRRRKIECEAITTIGVDRCSFVWDVEVPNTSAWSETRNFDLPDQTPLEVIISAPEDGVLINIKRRRGTEVFATCRMSLVDFSGNERYSQSAGHLFRSDNDAVWKFPTFFTKTQLKDTRNPLLPCFSFHALPMDTLLECDTFILTCSFSIPNGINMKEVRYRTLPLISAPCTEVPVSSLQSDLRDMFTSKKHADVKLRVDKEIFPAHKGLLAARSPVFSAMFDQDMLESRTGVVDIEDMDVKTMNSFLEFMYTGMVEDMDYANASKLLIAAEKYQVLSLKEKCAVFLMSILSEENVCEIIALSDMVGHEILKTSSLDCMKSHAGSILRSPQWTQWIGNNVQLATEILCILSTDIASVK